MMRKLWIVLALAGCAGRQAEWEKDQAAAKAPPAATEAAAADPLAEAEAAWKLRDDKAQHEKAIAALEKVVAAKPDDARALAWLSRAYYFYAESYFRNLEEHKDDYLAWTEKGTAAGEKAMMAASPEFAEAIKGGAKVEEACGKVSPNGIEAIYWYGTNLGKWARAAGFTKILSNRPKAQACIQRAYDIDKTFFNGAPPRYFGAVYAVLPGAFGGDLDKSKTFYDESLSIAPKYAGTMVLMAENYAVKRQDRALFEKLLNDVIAMPDDVIPEVAPETKVEKAKAKELLARADDLF